MEKADINDRNSRLKQLIDKTYPARGRFSVLESISGINSTRWRNFYYGKQNASTDMIDFWCTKYPADVDWLMNGVENKTDDGYPFYGIPPEASFLTTIADRLVWVIYELSSPRGDRLFYYLQGISNDKISAAEWSRLILEKTEPTAEMVRVVCNNRRFFTDWVIHGSAYYIQVDPTNKRSVENFNKIENEIMKSVISSQQDVRNKP